MKKTDTLIKIMTGCVLLAMVAYLSVYLVRRVLDPVQTALAVEASMSASSTMSGLVLRDELILRSDEQYIDLVVDDGEKVAAGQTVAVAYSSEDALARATDLDTLSRQIAEVKADLEDAEVVTAGNREESVYAALTELSVAVRGGALAGVDAQESAVASLLFPAEESNATEEYLSQLQQTYDALAETAAGDTTAITVGQGGTFSTIIDGYEGVGVDYVKGLGPASLRELIDADRIVPEDAIGKLIPSFRWYYAAIMNAEDAENLVAGRTVQMSFGRYYGEEMTAEVEYVGRAEGREQLVLFSMDRGFQEMLTVRSVSAEVVYTSYTGLRVPLTGLYRYYAGYVSEADGKRISKGDEVTLLLGGVEYEATVSEVGEAYAYGPLPEGVESGSEADERPKRCQVVLYWPWADTEGPDFSSGSGTITLADGETKILITNHYDYDPDVDRMCVFTMTGLKAERKKVTLVYAGEEYALVSSEGEDALREGNEIVLKSRGLFNGKVLY